MPKIMALDCEFNQPSRKTIEIGAAVYDVRSAALVDRFQTYVDPGEPITPYITDLTTITDANVRGAPNIKEAFSALKSFHEKHQCFMNPLVWGSGVRNDSLALYEEAAPSEPNFMGFRVVDAKTLYQSVMMFENLKARGGLKDACERLGIGFEGTSHTALADAMNTFRLWYYLVRMFHDGYQGSGRKFK